MNAIHVRHKEYINDILTASTGTPSIFQLQSFPINPGQAGTFPWLSTIAGNYTYYKFVKLTFYFASTSATALNSTNTALGTVMARVQYDPLISADTSKIQLENSYDSHRCNPSQSFTYPVELRTKNNELSVRTGAQPSNTDLRFYDEGYFEIATIGMQANGTNIGELWVEYEVILYKPIYIQGELGQTMRSCHYQLTGVATTAMLGTSQTSKGDYIGVTFGGTTTGTITFPTNISQGTYLCVYSGLGSATNNVSTPICTVTNGSLLSLWYNDTTVEARAPHNAATNTGVASFCVVAVFQINAPGALQAVLNFPNTGVTFPTSLTGVDIVCTQLNSLITT